MSSVKHDQFMFGKFLEKKEDRETQEMVKNERISKKGNRVKKQEKTKVLRQLYVRSGSLGSRQKGKMFF